MTGKQRAFCHEYVKDFHITNSAIRAGYSEKTAYSIGHENLKKPEIKEYIDQLLQESAMTAEEAVWRMGRAARLDLSQYMEGTGRQTWLDVEKLKKDGMGWVIKGLKYNSKGAPIYELWDGQQALTKIYDNVTPQQGDSERPFTIKVTLGDD